MYILKNALVSITRNKGRNLLIGLIVVVIACATTITLAIRNSATSLITSYEEKYDVKATIGINRENMMGGMPHDRDMSEEDREEQRNNMADIFASASNISLEDIKSYGDSEYVKDYYYTLSVGVNSNDIDKASMEASDDNGEFRGRPNGMGGKENFQNMNSSDFTLIGYSSLNSMEDFISGRYKITDGEISTDLESMTCVINKELATLNTLEVGDEITFVDPEDEDNTITLTISGIYEEETETTDAMGMFTTSANTIITNPTVVNTLTSNNEEMKTSLTPTFILTNKDVIDDFSSELTTKGLSEYLTVSTNLEEVESATKTISNVNTFAKTFLIITLIIGGIVLFVINMINIRERKYEIGVLRTIGMKKSHLTFQFITELMLVTFVSLIIGAGIGSVTSVPVSNQLLQNEIANQTSERENIEDNFGGPKDRFDKDKINGIPNTIAFDSIDAVVDYKVLLELLLIGALLTLVSSASSMISIQKFSPLTILKERS